jgi:homoserine dehydrogenase
MKIAIAGIGTVGVGLIKLLAENSAEISARVGTFEVVAVSARSRDKTRAIDISKYKWCDNPIELAQTDADIVVELIGGVAGDALALTKAALAAKKHVITANKAMLAHHGFELAQLAEKNGVVLAYEAAVAGGIPVIKALREGFSGNKIQRVTGILNGTCNYILTEMLTRNLEYADVLHEAQEKGYAEADPSFDVGGIDAAHKICLLAANAFGKRPNFAAMYIEGIDKITLQDLKIAQKLGYKIKHLCFAVAGEGEYAYPCLIKESEQLARVDGVFNAVEIFAEPVGQSVMVGRGAGAGPTASAVFSDIADIALKRKTATFNVPTANLREAKNQDIALANHAYYLRLDVADVAGVLEEVTHELKAHGISVKKLLQDEPNAGDAQIVIITHEVQETEILQALASLEKLKNIKQKPQMVRIYE